MELVLKYLTDRGYSADGFRRNVVSIIKSTRKYALINMRLEISNQRSLSVINEFITIDIYPEILRGYSHDYEELVLDKVMNDPHRILTHYNEELLVDEKDW